jgi:beta-phosphoglucomutase
MESGIGAQQHRRIAMLKFHPAAVIFDLDGVICFTDQYHYQAWKALADRLGIYFDQKINDRLRGVSRMASLEIILERSDQTYTPAEKAAFAEEKNNIYRELLKQMSPADLTDEVRDTLTELRRRGYKLAIGSSSKNTKFILKQIGLENFFDAIADGTDITRSKPDPEVFLLAASKLGAVPADCVVVEDAKAGIEAAKTGGMTALALFGDARDCGQEDYDLSSFGDLLNVL